MGETRIAWERFGSLWTYKAGEFVFYEGDPGDSVVVIHSGRVAIVKDVDSPTPLTLGVREAGRLVGEVSLIRETARTASVQALEPTEAWIIPRSAFWHEFETDPDFRRSVLMALISHLMVADESRRTAASVERALSEAVLLRQQTTNFIVHDLQNPLNVMVATLSLMEDVPEVMAYPDIVESIQLARVSVDRMLNLVAALLDAEKLKGGVSNLDVQPENLAEIIAEVVSRSQVVARSKEITVESPVRNGGLPPVTIDRMRIDRVLTNLVDNALKFTPHGGTITIDAEKQDGAIHVSVNDTGLGIPPEDRGRVFEHFVQTQSGRMTRKGFGLGLAYCLTAVEAHGGGIWVEEGAGGQGARFVFSLPLGRPSNPTVE